MAHGDFNHIEFPADEMARARRFYEVVFGWQFDDAPGFEDYLVYRTPGGLGGGLGKRNVTAAAAMRDYIEVDRLDDAIAKVQQAGGMVTMGRTEVQGQGWYAVIKDTEGNELGIWENLPR